MASDQFQATACLLCGLRPIVADHAVHVPGQPDKLVDIPLCGDCHYNAGTGSWFELLEHKLKVMASASPVKGGRLTDRDIADQYRLVADVKSRYRGPVLIR